MHVHDPQPVRIDITDTLDLHTFRPAEVGDLLPEYFRACLEKGIFEVRVIHGKGSGALKKRVRAILDRDPRVVSYTDAPADAGGWGVTRVVLKPLSDSRKWGS